MKVMIIAAVAHAVNAAYCLSLGDASQAEWADAPEWQKQSAVNGVQMHLANPDATPEQSHASWLAQKVADGWTYGEVKDETAKTHPCCRPYDELPPEQKTKDYLFRAVVHALNPIVPEDGASDDVDARIQELTDQLTLTRNQLARAEETADAAHAAAKGSSNDATAVGGVSVEYIGLKSSFKDHLYGTGLEWVAGQSRSLPPHLAKEFLRHQDLFKRGEDTVASTESIQGDDTSKVLNEQSKREQERNKRELDLADLLGSVSRMDKAALTEIGARYGVKIPRNATKEAVEKARGDIVNKVNELGAV